MQISINNNPRKMTDNIGTAWGTGVGLWIGIKLLFITDPSGWHTFFNIMGTLILAFAGGAAAKGGGYVAEKFLETKKKAKELFKRKQRP